MLIKRSVAARIKINKASMHFAKLFIDYLLSYVIIIIIIIINYL